MKPYKIPTGSMKPTLAIGQRILVNRLSGNPGLGDIVVFHPRPELTLTMRSAPIRVKAQDTNSHAAQRGRTSRI